MIKGNLSNIPAREVYVDGCTFVEPGIIGWKAIRESSLIIEKLYNDHTIIFWFKLGTLVRKPSKDLDVMKGYLFNRFVFDEADLLMYRLQKKKKKMVTGRIKLYNHYPQTTILLEEGFELIRRAV